jgi:hypothetical protein
LAALLFQITPATGVNIDPNWVIGLLLGAISVLAGVIGFLYRVQVAESKRKDELIDRLLRQANRTVDVTDRTVSLAEKRQRGTDR